MCVCVCVCVCVCTRALTLRRAPRTRARARAPSLAVVLADLLVTAHTSPLYSLRLEYQLLALAAQLTTLLATSLALFWVLAPTTLVVRAQVSMGAHAAA